MEQIRPMTSLSHDELIARIEQYMVVVELRDAEIRELHAANSALLAERDALREVLSQMVDVAERVDSWQSFPQGPIDKARAALAQEQGGSDDNQD